MSKTALNLSQNKSKFAGSILLLALFIVPFFSFAKSEKIYVDDNASGTENGSQSHPYKTIKSALKHADDGDKVIVKPGTYKENVEVPEEVKLIGESNSKVIIEAKDDDDPTVYLRDDSEVNNVTIKNGKSGVKVKENAEAKILSCIIRNNDGNGIEVKSGKVEKKSEVVISGNVIKENGRKGIFSERRYISIINNEIKGNKNDGVDIARGSYVSLEGNLIKENRGSGLKLVLDGSSVWTKNNRLAENKREGVEVNAYGGSGKIVFKSSKFVKNDRYGIARIIRGNAGSAVFNGMTVESSVELWENAIGNISPIIRVQ